MTANNGSDGTKDANGRGGIAGSCVTTDNPDLDGLFGGAEPPTGEYTGSLGHTVGGTILPDKSKGKLEEDANDGNK